MNNGEGVDLVKVINEWGKIAQYPKSVEEALAVVKRLESVWGPLVEAYVPQETKPHVAMKFTTNDGVNQAWINVGHVDYRLFFEHSADSGNPGIGRTYLSSTRESGSLKTNKNSQIPTTQCPDFHTPFPITGSCECGWKP